jgi:hypothetical protein
MIFHETNIPVGITIHEFPEHEDKVTATDKNISKLIINHCKTS